MISRSIVKTVRSFAEALANDYNISDFKEQVIIQLPCRVFDLLYYDYHYQNSLLGISKFKTWSTPLSNASMQFQTIIGEITIRRSYSYKERKFEGY